MQAAEQLAEAALAQGLMDCRQSEGLLGTALHAVPLDNRRVHGHVKSCAGSCGPAGSMIFWL